MFWKKEIKEKEKHGAFFKDLPEPRESFRVKPSSAEPIFVEIEGKSLHVTSISSGGISFVNEGLQPSDTYKINFVLPHKKIDIQAELKIIRIEDNICHGHFFNISVEIVDHIHDYVLYRQKEDLRSGF